jgi:Na+/melibiose symporter-like transporter
MTDPETQTGSLAGDVSGAERATVDTRRARTLVGLSLGLVGPRAYLAVSGVLLILLVSSRATSALAITFALSAHRLLGLIAYPVFGRAGDRTRSAAGRRAPYMAAGLVVMAACTWAYTVVPGYWPLVCMVVTAKTAAVVFGLSNAVVLPEAFGKSRAVKAAVMVGILGGLASLAIKGTVLATWRSEDPATWSLAFRVAAGIMVGAALLILGLVRESRAAVDTVEAERRRPQVRWRTEAANILAAPNGRVLSLGVLVFWAGISATGYLVVVYLQKVQHASAAVQTLAGWVMGAPVAVFGAVVGWLLSRTFTRRQIAVGAPALGAVLSVLQFFSAHIWQTVVLAFAGAPLFGAFVISLAPMLLRLLPDGGGAGELVGKLLAPFSVFAMVFAFLAAWAVDLTGDYRVIWLFPAIAGIVQAALLCRLWIPPGEERPVLDGLFMRLGAWLLEQVTSRERRLVTGEITAEDANAASLFAAARELLGDPYDSASKTEPAPV